MDLVSLLAVLVFAGSWFLYSRSDDSEVVVRLFFRMMMVVGAAIGILGIILRRLMM